MDAFLAKISPADRIARHHTHPCACWPDSMRRGGRTGRRLAGTARGRRSRHGVTVTAGGIHTALKHGLAAGNAVADFLSGRAEDPSGWFVRSYPKFRAKRMLRFLFDHFQSDFAFNSLLATWPMRAAASIAYFHHKGVFDPAERNRSAFHRLDAATGYAALGARNATLTPHEAGPCLSSVLGVDTAAERAAGGSGSGCGL